MNPFNAVNMQLLLKIILVIGAAIAGIMSYRTFRMEKDNPIEQRAESIIENETGWSIDLSPEDTGLIS